MLLGTPVLTSDAGALPEVSGDAALTVDPYDTQAITRGIRRLDADADLRAELSVRGRARAAEFSPQKYQERLSLLYERFR
jgi:glycosyltransferase involved in cell wall biosynthesis